MIRSYWQAFIIIAILEFSVLIAGFWMLGDYEVKRFNVWPISEWLINYQGGFVRRGLMGELLRFFSQGQKIIPTLNPLVLIFFYTYIAIFISVYQLAKIQRASLLIIALLIPGGIFHMAIGAIFYPRKEILFLIHFGILCLLYLILLGCKSNRKTIFLNLFGIVAIVGGSLLMLIHEAYFFMAYPITVLLFFILYRENITYFPLKFQLISFILVVPILFLICTIYRGNSDVAQIIWDSYTLSDRIILAPAAPYTAGYATAGLGWTTNQHLSTLYGVYISGTWIYWFFFYIANALVIIYSAIQISLGFNTDRKSISKESSKNLALVLVTIGAWLISSSMFFIASDYGRWIACASNLTILFLFTISRSTFIRTLNKVLNTLHKTLHSYFYRFGSSLIVLMVILGYELIFQMPECCISEGDIYIPYLKFIGLYQTN